MSRYFVAVTPQGLGENPMLKQLVGKMKRTFDGRELGARWVPPVLWHITLQFLGELTPDRRDELFDAVNSWAPPEAHFDLRLQGLGGFPADDQARVLWVGVQESQPLLNLQADLGRVLKEKAFLLEDRAYRPHLTLARLRNPHSIADMVAMGARKHFGDYKISEVIVFESVLQGNIPKYMPQLRRGI